MPTHQMAAALEDWDARVAEDEGIDTLVLSFFSDERPLQGVAALIDWRLGGQLSRFIMQGSISGQRGESLLMPAGHKIPFERILFLGLGESAAFNTTSFEEHRAWIDGVLNKAKIKEYALQIPGRATEVFSEKLAQEMWTQKGIGEQEISFIGS